MNVSLIVESVQTKTCPGCKNCQPLENFGICNRNKDKRQVYCKTCRKKYNLKNREYILERAKKYYRNHVQDQKEYDKIYCLKNKEIINKKRLQRCHNNINFRLRKNYSGRIRTVFNKLNFKTTSSKVLFCGCTINELKIYLEHYFTNGITWDNYGQFGWHIDHIIPCAFFDLTDQTELKQCFHYTNLRPLWRDENLSKGDRLIAANYNDQTPFI